MTPLPTPAQAAVFRAYVQTGSQKEAARVCGISAWTVKRHMHEMYERLGVGGAMEAAAALGWVVLPGEGPKACGWVGYCSRALGHRGHHGGMRAFDPNVTVAPIFGSRAFGPYAPLDPRKRRSMTVDPALIATGVSSAVLT